MTKMAGALCGLILSASTAGEAEGGAFWERTVAMLKTDKGAARK